MTNAPDQSYPYLLPQPDEDTQPFWDALKRHEVRMQRCTECSEWQFPPRKGCRTCGSEKSEWVQLSGRGTVYSYIVVYQPVLSAWREDIPYEIIMVQPEEICSEEIRVVNNGPDKVFYGNFSGDVPREGPSGELSQLKIGLPVEAVFDSVTDDVTILRWRPLNGL